jgi:hypothetical protein
MPRYFFGLDNAAEPPEQDGEELANDKEALKYAEVIADELGRNASRKGVVVFNAEGKRVRDHSN